jgi:hypothetical protein
MQAVAARRAILIFIVVIVAWRCKCERKTSYFIHEIISLVYDWKMRVDGGVCVCEEEACRKRKVQQKEKIRPPAARMI